MPHAHLRPTAIGRQPGRIDPGMPEARASTKNQEPLIEPRSLLRPSHTTTVRQQRPDSLGHPQEPTACKSPCCAIVVQRGIAACVQEHCQACPCTALWFWDLLKMALHDLCVRQRLASGFGQLDILASPIRYPRLGSYSMSRLFGISHTPTSKAELAPHDTGRAMLMGHLWQSATAAAHIRDTMSAPTTVQTDGNEEILGT
ncbi:hypothetical protein CCMA1212_007315 [Trichoderma ghanense]|uniref:Uncharacterized protein n=1 Tax=Trichoderma ghanense TaxID=65468 RepID=A0ABY2GY94_9HYPO